MNLEFFYSHLGRAFFFLALALMAFAFGEILANLLGFSLFAERYGAGRLIELAGALLAVVIVILLRQIRDGQKLK